MAADLPAWKASRLSPLEALRRSSLGVTEDLSLEMKKKNEKNYQSTIPIVGTFDDSRINIVLKSIDRSPGVRYRELLRLSGLTNGALEYTLRILEKETE